MMMMMMMIMTWITCQMMSSRGGIPPPPPFPTNKGAPKISQAMLYIESVTWKSIKKTQTNDTYN